MHELTPHQKAALDYKHHISLTANAGSGKTFVLAKRYVAIAREENIPLSKIVAITFTEKAAGELNRKIATEIDEQINSEKDTAKLKTLNRMRRQLTSANISTIHSFCINLLREFSPEAGIDANFAPINQADADDQLNLTIQEFIKSNLVDTHFSSSLKDSIRLLGGRQNFENEMKMILQKSKELEHLLKSLYAKDDNAIVEFYINYINTYLEQLLSGEILKLIDAVSQLNKRVLEIDESNDLARGTEDLIKNFIDEKSVNGKIKNLAAIANNVLTKSKSVKKRGYINKEYENNSELISLIESEFKNYEKLIEINIDENEHHELVLYSRKIFELAIQIHLNYGKRKRKLGYLDFEDILIETKKLTNNKDVVEQLYEKFDYIMIDEYQDTNEIQYEIFIPILNNLSHGNLFVVGDEKQSIYMFRDAELEIFNRTRNEITEINEEGNLLLPHSFRVAPQIAHTVNELFKNLLSDPRAFYNEVSYDELVCSRPEDSNGKFELLVTDDENLEEADLISAKISEKVEDNSDLSFGDFAVLCRKRNSFLELEKSFNDAGIPYIIAGGKGFFQRQTVYDIYNYISFLLNPKDDAALLGILRSPFFLFQDDLLLEISLGSGQNYFDKLKEFALSNSGYNSIIDLLVKHINLSASIRISALLEEIFRSTNYWGIVAGRNNYKQEISNLFKLIGVARNHSLQSFKTLYDFKVFLNEAISLFEDEGQAQLADYTDAVKIMTLHQSKGLEFKHVFLFKSNDRVREESIKSKSLEIHKELGILTKIPLGKKYFQEYATPAVLEIQNHIQRQKQKAENKRLLYVGMTRAVDELYITGDLGKGRIENDSFFYLVINGLGINISNEEYVLKSKLKFMRGAEDDFKIYEKPFETSIRILRNLEADEFKKQVEPEINSFTNYKIDKIDDHEKNEIISATKIAIYTQCPTKYYLTYELGYTELLKVTRTFTNNFDFRPDEDDEINIYADIKGQIIHRLFELDAKRKDLDSLLDTIIPKFLSGPEVYDINKIKSRIKEEVIPYYESNTYEEISSKKNFVNEFEVYAKEEDYYIFGIIDKLIIDNGRVTIIDYKTDNLNFSLVESKAEHYKPQMQFYAYTIRKRYPAQTEIKVKLVFIQKPENPVEFSFSPKDLEDFGNYIRESVHKIRKQEFVKNLEHCRECHFSVDGKCVYQV